MSPTLALLLSRGLTVFLFLISGNRSTPWLASSVACRDTKHHLLSTPASLDSHVSEHAQPLLHSFKWHRAVFSLCNEECGAG